MLGIDRKVLWRRDVEHPSAKIEGDKPSPSSGGLPAMTAIEPQRTLSCSFCGKSKHQVQKLIAGPSVFICGACVARCAEIIDDEEIANLIGEDLEAATERLRQRSTEILLAYVELRQKDVAPVQADLAE